MRQPTVLIFAKPPRIGLSKTRLAKSLGSPVEARRIATMAQARTLRAALNGNWQTILYTAPDAELSGSLGGLWPAHLERRSQGPGDLGDRLSKGLREAPAGPVIFIGADAPGISTALIRKAVRALQRGDAVFGPAKDGGFWLFGINKTGRTSSPFHGVRWSSPNAMADLKAKLPDDAKITLLPELIDIDHADDVKAWQSTGAATSMLAAPTATSGPAKKKGFFARLFGRS